MKDKKDPRDVALKRYAPIAPLLEDGLEPAEARQRRAEILAKETAVSERTLRRHLAAYREQGFDGLCPKRRLDAGKPRAVPVEVLEEAAALKRELPQRTVQRIIEILEGEGRVKRGTLRPSTLARHFTKRGLMEILKTPRVVSAVSKRSIGTAFGRWISNTGRICRTRGIPRKRGGRTFWPSSTITRGSCRTPGFTSNRSCLCWRTACARRS